MTPIEALEQAIYYLDRAHDTGFKSKAFIRALETARATPGDELIERATNETLGELDGIGSSTAKVITEALHGESSYLTKLESETRVPVSAEGERYLKALRGDCHMHSRWSDGGATIEAMSKTARALGHEYMVLTDHSPRLTIAHGLDRERLLRQLDDIAVLNASFDDFRILTGMEVDILEDGALDLDDDLLARLDVVVASVHSKLRMESALMTQRMVLAAASPHVDILGHCTGRMIGKRPASDFDADYVFAACAAYNTAVEFNCRPERLDPPKELVAIALEHGCYFSIDSDAHATGQLEWLPLGCDRAAQTHVPIDRVINTWPVDELLSWTSA